MSFSCIFSKLCYNYLRIFLFPVNSSISSQIGLFLLNIILLGGFMKTFFNDSDGFSLQDLEKILLCFLFLTVVVVILYMWVVKSTESALMNELAYAIGGFTILRKGLSYFKSPNYSLGADVSISTEQVQQQTQTEVK